MITFRNIGKLGRFANGCFQIASTIGIAVKHNYQYAFPEWKNWDGLNFESGIDIDVQKYFVNPLPYAEDLERFPEVWVNRGYTSERFPDNISLNGHLQSPKYFAHCMNVIQHYFRMKDEPEQNDFIAIHFRAGDYTDGKETYHPRCDREYYEKAINMFDKKDRDNMVVFSDDFDAACDLFEPLIGYGRVTTGNTYLEDFKLMKRCKSFICANSSFSAFAALLGEHPDKKMIFPSLWFGAAAGGLNAHDIYPDNAIII